MQPDPGGRSQPAQSISFEGREIPIKEGATIAAALLAAGEPRLRETRDRDRRGVFCGMGVCGECLVVVDGQPGQRACMTPARAGMSVSRQPALPQLSRRARPAEAPAKLTGAAVAAGAAAVSSEHVRKCDVLVIGGGPGGLSAAAVAAEAGLDVVLVDERAKLGGQYFKQPASERMPSGPPPDAQFAAGEALIDRVRSAAVEVWAGAQVWGAFALDEIEALAADGRCRRLRPRALILAPGAYERGIPLPGWTLPGVMTTGAAQTLWRSYATAPGRRVLVSGNGPLNMQVAAELTRSGATVAGLAELAAPVSSSRLPSLARMALADPRLIGNGARYRATLARARVPVIYGAAVVRIEGEGRAESAVVMAIDASGRPQPGSERRFEVDAVCLGFGFMPSTEIARALGCRHRHDAETGQLLTVVDDRGATSIAKVWVVGDGGGIRGAPHAQAQGTLAGLDAVRAIRGSIERSLRQGERAAEAAIARHRRFQAALGDAFRARPLQQRLAGDDTYLCRCEGVTRAAIEQALRDQAGHAGAVKRLTRAGMGSCQGRYCAPLIASMIAARTAAPQGELSGLAPVPPVKPVQIGRLCRSAYGENGEMSSCGVSPQTSSASVRPSSGAAVNPM